MRTLKSGKYNIKTVAARVDGAVGGVTNDGRSIQEAILEILRNENTQCKSLYEGEDRGWQGFFFPTREIQIKVAFSGKNFSCNVRHQNMDYVLLSHRRKGNVVHEGKGNQAENEELLEGKWYSEGDCSATLFIYFTVPLNKTA